MVKPLTTARLACGCILAFQDAGPGAPVTVVVQRKSEACALAIHVAGMPLYDHRAAVRPATRVTPPVQPDYEEN